MLLFHFVLYGTDHASQRKQDIKVKYILVKYKYFSQAGLNGYDTLLSLMLLCHEVIWLVVHKLLCHIRIIINVKIVCIKVLIIIVFYIISFLQD